MQPLAVSFQRTAKTCAVKKAGSGWLASKSRSVGGLNADS
jgi:hypothetical protein